MPLPWALQAVALKLDAVGRFVFPLHPQSCRPITTSQTSFRKDLKESFFPATLHRCWEEKEGEKVLQKLRRKINVGESLILFRNKVFPLQYIYRKDYRNTGVAASAAKNWLLCKTQDKSAIDMIQYQWHVLVACALKEKLKLLYTNSRPYFIILMWKCYIMLHQNVPLGIWMLVYCTNMIWTHSFWHFELNIEISCHKWGHVKV